MKRADIFRLAIGAGGAALAAYFAQRNRDRTKQAALGGAVLGALQGAMNLQRRRSPAEEAMVRHALEVTTMVSDPIIEALERRARACQAHQQLNMTQRPSGNEPTRIKDADFTLIEDDDEEPL